jgi:hypothetical protein
MCEMTSSRRWAVRWRGKRTVGVSKVQAVRTLSPTKGDVSNVGRTRCIHSGNALQLQRSFVPEQHLRCILDSSPPGVDELLEEDLPEYPVRLFAEYGREDNGDSVVAGFDVYRFLLSVVNRARATAFCYTLWR